MRRLATPCQLSPPPRPSIPFLPEIYTRSVRVCGDRVRFEFEQRPFSSFFFLNGVFKKIVSRLFDVVEMNFEKKKSIDEFFDRVVRLFLFFLRSNTICTKMSKSTQSFPLCSLVGSLSPIILTRARHSDIDVGLYVSVNAVIFLGNESIACY